MKTRFNTKAYRKRPPAEIAFAMTKRNLGSSLRGRSHWSRCRDLYLRVLTHNIAIALLRVFYRALPTPFDLQEQSVQPNTANRAKENR